MARHSGVRIKKIGLSEGHEINEKGDLVLDWLTNRLRSLLTPPTYQTRLLRALTADSFWEILRP